MKIKYRSQNPHLVDYFEKEKICNKVAFYPTPKVK